jgi:hypothetical protein
MPSWPASLPQAPLIEGYGETPPDLVLRSQTDGGWAKTRARATAGPTRIVATYAMTGTQLAAFETFVSSDIAERTLAFDWPRPRTGATVSVRMVVVPVIVPAGGADRWTVGLTLETMP